MNFELTIIKCPNCATELITAGKYDDHVHSIITCPECDFSVTKSTYEFVKEMTEEDIESLLSENCCDCDGCDSCLE